jgi:multiple sugar transport system permease protein
LLAGLQTVPPELCEAATIDGASGRQRYRFVTLPLLEPIILIVTLFSVIFTFADFHLVYVLTHGEPQNATQLFATYRLRHRNGSADFHATIYIWKK